MSDRLSALPDDILCSMLSLLTIWDSVRTRLLSARWRYLLDDRSVLIIDYKNVLYPSRESDSKLKLMTAIDQVLELRKGRNHIAFKLDILEPDLQASDVDRWVESCIKMKIETLELSLYPREDDPYVVPDKLFQSYHSRKAFHLKSLQLICCALTFSSECSSWISHLTTLDLAYVPLQQKDIVCVVSGALNLTSLSLSHCGEKDYLPLPIIVQLPRLKDLFVIKSECFNQVELICPNLESFVCVDQEAMDIKFSHVPLLKELDLRNTFYCPNDSLMFDDLARNTPKLNELVFYVLNEVQPLPISITLRCLKRLDLYIGWFNHFDNHYDETDFDLFSIAYLLNASPFLETLHLNKWTCDNEQNGARVQQREYLDNPHLHLKEVKIEGFRRTWNEMEFSRYLLKNAAALERMILVDHCRCSSTREVMGNSKFCARGTLSYATICRLPGIEEMVTTYCSLKREEMAKALLKDLETNAELVFRRDSNVVLIASNQVGYGVHLFRPDSKEDEK